MHQEFTSTLEINGWIPLISNLEKLAQQEGSKVRFISVCTEQNEYLHFVSLSLEIIYGVLQFTHLKLDRKKELTEDGKLRGTWGSECVFYDNLKLVLHN